MEIKPTAITKVAPKSRIFSNLLKREQSSKKTSHVPQV